MEYVRVAEDEQDQEPIELPIEEDGTILLSTVTGQFPGACGLKYRNPDTGSWRGLRLADERLQFPGGSWMDTIYVVVYPKGSGSDNKRKGEESAGNPAGKTRRLDVKKNQDLVVLGLPWKTTEEELKAYFEQFGEVVFSEIKYDRDTRRSRGFGFVRFADAETGHQVMMKKHMIQGRTCEVKVPDSRPERSKLFVRCLSKDMTEQDLKEYFSEFGEVTEVYLPTPHRGFAFVTFEDGDLAQELKERDHIIKGHHVQLNDAEPKSKNRNQWGEMNEGGNFGGGAGGGGGFGGRGDGQYRDYRGRDFHDDRDRGNRGRGRYDGNARDQGMGAMGNQLPMALAAALNQAGWNMLLAQGMQGQGGGHSHPNQGGGQSLGSSANTGSQQQMGGNTDGLGGGYGSPHGMSWSQGNQTGPAGDNSSFFGNQNKGSW